DQSERGEHDARRADPALGADLVEDRLLERVRAAQALDRHDRGVLDLGDGDQARDDRLAVDQHGARAALAFAAALLRAGEPEVLAQHVEQALERVDVEHARLAVHDELHARAPFDWARRGDACSTSGVAGIARTSSPAWRIAFTTAGAGPSIGSSPSPF